MQDEKRIAWIGRTQPSDVLARKIVGYLSAVKIVDFDSARTDELVRLWRESFEFGVGVVDPHPIEDQRDHFVNTVVPNNAVRMAVLDDQLVGFIAATKESIAHCMCALDIITVVSALNFSHGRKPSRSENSGCTHLPATRRRALFTRNTGS